jgi:HAD superfamily hydrolase (TIGR01549 family)
MQVETVFLDAGSVIVFPNWERVSDVLAEHGVRISSGALRRGEPAAKRSIDHDEGAASHDAARGWTYVHRVLENAGVPPSPDVDRALDQIGAYHATHNLWDHVPAEVPPALARLSATGRRLVVVSNSNGTLARLLDRVGLATYFHTVCDSCDEGIEKPDPRYFQIALSRAGARAETTVHVGDLYHIDVVGARRAGIRAILMDPHDLYGEFDVERVHSLDELADLLAGA